MISLFEKLEQEKPKARVDELTERNLGKAQGISIAQEQLENIPYREAIWVVWNKMFNESLDNNDSEGVIGVRKYREKLTEFKDAVTKEMHEVLLGRQKEKQQ